MLKGILLNLQLFKRAIFFPSSPGSGSASAQCSFSPFQFARSIEKPIWGWLSLPQRDGNTEGRVGLFGEHILSPPCAL